MRNDRAPVRSQDGFTLIEVLIAMVILSVGLLGLEALGIGATRMIGRAERQSRLSTMAATRLENELTLARANPALRSSCEVPSTGDTICVTVAAITGVADVRRVTVTVRPKPGSARVETFEVSSSVYDPAIP